MSDAHPPVEDNRSAPQHTNRLIHESSPYLLQHAHNPVDWYPWGPEALETARREDKPIFLSIGYSACHWCHVMESESFQNEDTARLMNDLFVCVKVDREERPDLDALYMDAVQALTGSGGWPMTVFLTPDGAPFFGGTYFPPVSRYGMPGLPQLLRSIATLYRTRRDDVERQAEEFRQFYARRGSVKIELPLAAGADSVLQPDALAEAAERLLGEMDAVEGGFGRAPKFPHAMAIEFLLRVASRSTEGGADGDDLRRLLLLTLDKMADGGIYDQVGGGFHRYSTDTHWLVPHFEKMLYDNALLASAYLHAWQLYGDARYRLICEQTLDYVLREMTDATGAFYSTQDADSEGEEGKFYVWTPAELESALGARDAAILAALWGVTGAGNFEGKNILHTARDLATVAAAFGVSREQLDAIVAGARQTLYDERAKRVWPGLDDKALASWNGLMLRAFADAGRALDRADYRQAAVANATFVLDELLRDGALLRVWRRGRAKIGAYLEDYAALANGMLSVYEATGLTRFFAAAQRLCDGIHQRFWDADKGAFFDTAHDHEVLIGRPREITDNATPSGMSLAVEALLRLWSLNGDERYYDVAARVLTTFAPAALGQPSAFGHLLCALDDFIGPFAEIAIVGDASDERTQRLLRATSGRYLPRAVLATGSGVTSSPDDPPLLEGRGTIGGAPAAYVCRRFVCKRPVTDPDALTALLRAEAD
ncbi:MAG TPA: thioredoxin domain-containing protein [Ktedonobacterales bacterium]|nr:thioredoxin domain-containing protein [Ktedonobacterales bacterium]